MKLSNRIQVPRLTSVAALSMMAVYLSGCTYAETRAMQKDIDHSAATAVDTPIQSHLVVQVHEGSLLMGEKISASKAAPEIYNRIVDFNSGGSSPSLTDIASYLTDIVHVPTEIDSSVNQSMGAAAPVPATVGGGINISARPAGRVPDLPAGLATSLGASGFAGAVGFGSGPIRYHGRLQGLLDVADARFGVWSHYKDGKVSFFRSETRSFQIGSLAEQSSMTCTISSGGSGRSGGSSGGGGGGGSGGSQQQSIDNGNQSMGLQLTVNP